MKLLKENGMLNEEVLEALCWELTMVDLKIKPTHDGVWLVDRADWRDNVSNIKLLKQTLWYVYDNTRTKQHYRNKKDSLETQLEAACFSVKLLTKEKEDIIIENNKLKEKIQEAQVTAGLFIQSVKDNFQVGLARRSELKIQVESKELYKFNNEHIDNIISFALTKYEDICNKYYSRANIFKKFMVAFKSPLTPAMFHSGEYLISNEEDLKYARYLRTLYFNAKGLKPACKYVPNTSQLLWLDEFETECYNFCIDFVEEKHGHR